MADIFGGTTPVSEGTTTTEENPLEIVKQKFKDDKGELDIAGLAKGKIESDKHISHLESELRGLRKELDTRLNYEQFLDEIKSAKATSSQDNQTTTNEVKALGKEDIATLVRDIVNQEKTQTQKSENLRQAQQGVMKAFGSNYEDKLTKAIADLGVSEEFAKQIAETNPTAFLKMIEAMPKGQASLEPTTAPPRGITRTAAQIDSGRRDFKFYEKLRKSDPGRYWSVQTQKQMHNDTFDQGEEFFS